MFTFFSYTHSKNWLSDDVVEIINQILASVPTLIEWRCGKLLKLSCISLFGCKIILHYYIFYSPLQL